MSYNEQSPMNQGNTPNNNGFPQQPLPNQSMPNNNGFPQQPSQASSFPQGSAAQNTTWSGAPVPTAPPKASKAKRILGILVPILAVILFAGLKIYRHQAEQLPKPGECIQIATKNNSSSDSDWKKVDCSDTKSMTFLVATKGTGTPSCPSDQYMSYSIVEKNTQNTKSYVCLVPNYSKDLCYDIDPNIPVPAACSAPEADFKVAEIAETANGTCSSEAEPYSFPIPGRTYCIAEPK